MRLSASYASRVWIIILAGHSFRRQEPSVMQEHRVDGVIALAPADHQAVISGLTPNSRTGASHGRCRQAGRNRTVDDPNSGGRLKQVKMSAQTYLDFLTQPGRPFDSNAAAVLPGTAVPTG